MGDMEVLSSCWIVRGWLYGGGVWRDDAHCNAADVKARRDCLNSN
jgi:hypothetical protein